MKEIKISAPGKIHLIGEHSVVYGEPAIITTVNLHTNLIFEESENIKIQISEQKFQYIQEELVILADQAMELWHLGKETNNFNNLFNLYNNNPLNFLKIALGNLINKFKVTKGFQIKETSNLPLGSGLGSSASFAVALAAGFEKFFTDTFNLETINQNAFSLEQIANGNPSGGDNACCCFGGLINFQKQPDSEQAIIKPLKINLSQESNKFILINTGKPEKTTGELVQQVSLLDPFFRKERCQLITSYISPLLLALENNDPDSISLCLNNTHSQLSELGVSTSLLNKLQSEIKKIGGGAKLCGAGGGGILLAYHQNPEELITIANKNKLKYYQVMLATEGVCFS